jgi:hypothetical protein
MENIKMSNYEVLKRLGFDRDFIDENKRLGLREKQAEMRMAKHAYLMDEMERRKGHGTS